MIPNSFEILNFAHRLNYTSDMSLPSTTIVDHVNKKYNIYADIHHILFDIIFWNTPEFVYNAIKESLYYQYSKSMTLDNIDEALKNIKINNIVGQYRTKSLSSILHPWVNINYRTNFRLVINNLFSKVFDKYDTYFNKDENAVPLTINTLTQTQIDFINIIADTDLILSGSLALWMYGSVYRKEIKDFDFILSTVYLPDDLLNLINETINNKHISFKDKVKAEEEIKTKFVKCRFYSKLNKLFNNKLKVSKVVIDRISEYDNIAKATFSIIYNYIEFDIIVRENVIYKHKMFPVTERNSNVLYGKKIKVQNVNDILYTKRLLGRIKDFKDLMMFKPHFTLVPDVKCQVKYDSD